jgi:IS30 family transposase
LRKKGYSYEDVGKALKRAPSAIWNEVSRNKVKGVYDPVKARYKAYTTRHNAKYQGMKIVEDKKLKKFVETSLLAGQSPAGISGRLKFKREKGLSYISKDSIYRYIKSVYGRKIETKLQKKKKRTRKRKNAGTLDGRTFIDKRPKYINDRTRVGDAEFDFIVSGKSGKGIVLTVVDRKLRKSFLEPIYVVNIPAVHRAAKNIKKRYLEWITGTTDNDLLFARHKELERELDIKIYFCNPYHSWEKGSIENVNWEIRKDIPKGSDISTYSKLFFKKLEKKLDDRFMECLDFQTPNEAILKHRRIKKLRDLRRKKKK